MYLEHFQVKSGKIQQAMRKKSINSDNYLLTPIDGGYCCCPFGHYSITFIKDLR